MVTIAPRMAIHGYPWEPPDLQHPTYSFVMAVRHGDLVFVSGQISITPEGGVLAGKLGADLDVATGFRAAGYCAASALLAAGTVAEVGEIGGVVSMTVFVNCAPDFTQQPSVAEGASRFLLDIFGDEMGKHARAAIGVASLPLGAAVEVQMVVRLR